LKTTVYRALSVILAAGISLAALSACGDDNTPTNAAEASASVSVASEDAAASGLPEEETVTAAEAANETVTEVPTATDAPTATEAPTTTEKPTTTRPEDYLPVTKAEIAEVFNTAANRVKTDKPGLSYQARTILSEEGITSTNGLIKTVAPPIIKMAKGMFASWSEPTVRAPGENCDGAMCVQGKSWSSRLKADWIKSASCTLDKASMTYKIQITLKDERVATLPEDGTSTHLGQVFRVFTKGEVYDGAADVGVYINKFDVSYSGCTITAEVNAKTRNLLSVTYLSNSTVGLQVKIMGMDFDAEMPLGQEYRFTINP
jgi:hypothetical protein